MAMKVVMRMRMMELMSMEMIFDKVGVDGMTPIWHIYIHLDNGKRVD